MARIIGIVGPAHSGKTALANQINQFITDNAPDMQVARLSFADPIKDIVSMLFKWDRQRLSSSDPADKQWKETPDEEWASILEIHGFSPRVAMQMIGTDLFRDHLSKDFWINILNKKIELIMENPNSVIIIDDVRFPNEANMIRRLGGEIIMVAAPNTSSNSEHISEKFYNSIKTDRQFVNKRCTGFEGLNEYCIATFN